MNASAPTVAPTQAAPVFFVSHGAPLDALDPGPHGALLQQAGALLDGAAALLVLSPHWMTPGLCLGSHPLPPTLYDFHGFPPALQQLRYPAQGAPALAARMQAHLQAAGWPAQLDAQRGLDHGAWVSLRQLRPQADRPVLPLSLPRRLDAEQAWQLGAALAPLLQRERVALVASGSLTHNLADMVLGGHGVASYVPPFVAWVLEALQSHDGERLRQTLQLAPHAARAHPSSEHFLPLLVAAGAAAAGQQQALTVLDGGVRHQALALQSFVWQ